MVDAAMRGTAAPASGTGCGVASGGKKKKLTWQQCSVTDTPVSRAKYVAACSDALAQRMAASRAATAGGGRDGGAGPEDAPTPTPHVHAARRRPHGFATIKRPARSEFALAAPCVTVLEQACFEHLRPHPAVAVPCAFCGRPISSVRLRRAFHEPRWPRPWFACCDDCYARCA